MSSSGKRLFLHFGPQTTTRAAQLRIPLVNVLDLPLDRLPDNSGSFAQRSAQLVCFAFNRCHQLKSMFQWFPQRANLVHLNALRASASSAHPLIRCRFVDTPPDNVLDPAEAWPSQDEHSRKYKELALRFVENMKKFADKTPEDVIAAGPKV
jgi:hypothetical protein